MPTDFCDLCLYLYLYIVFHVCSPHLPSVTLPWNHHHDKWRAIHNPLSIHLLP